MSSFLQKLIFVALFFSFFQIHAGEKEEVTKVASLYLNAFKKANLKEMKKYFYKNLSFDGDKKFINKNQLSKEELIKSYATLFNKIEKQKWSKVMDKVKPTIVKAQKDNEMFKAVKAGDYIYDLHFREAMKGKRRKLDEAIVFIFRKINGKYLIIHHYADY
jgi:hypothetical protein